MTFYCTALPAAVRRTQPPVPSACNREFRPSLRATPPPARRLPGWSRGCRQSTGCSTWSAARCAIQSASLKMILLHRTGEDHIPSVIPASQRNSSLPRINLGSKGARACPDSMGLTHGSIRRMHAAHVANLKTAENLCRTGRTRDRGPPDMADNSRNNWLGLSTGAVANGMS